MEHEEWTDGPRLDGTSLTESVYALWHEAAALTCDDTTAACPPVDVASAQAMLDESGGLLVGLLEGERPLDVRSAAGRLFLEHGRLTGDLRGVEVSRRLRGFAQVSAALARLRSMDRVELMIDRGAAELARCGFDRVMFTRIEGGIGTPTVVHIDDDPDLAQEILRVGRAVPMRLTHLLLESEMLRRRGPVLVADAQNDPRVHPELAAATRTRSYVAAPVMPHGHVIGFLHADCQVQRRAVDEVDRDLLWMFAEGFGHAYERAVLLARLTSLRQEVRRANASILAVMDEFCDAEVEVARVDAEEQGVARSAAAMFVTVDNRLESLLTPRELDVIRLMAMGETNAGIATKLVVSEGTVKSHVKHILRKLRASNRAEAVSRFVRLTQQYDAPARHG